MAVKFYDRLEREVMRNRNDGAPCIGYCHSGGGCCGITIVRLGEFKSRNPNRYIEVKGRMVDLGEYHIENTLSTGYLRKLNKCIKSKRGTLETVHIIAYLAPLSDVDKERVAKFVPMLVLADILE